MNQERLYGNGRARLLDVPASQQEVNNDQEDEESR